MRLIKKEFVPPKKEQINIRRSYPERRISLFATNSKHLKAGVCYNHPLRRLRNDNRPRRN